MSEPFQNRWRDGFWANKKMPSAIVAIEGDRLSTKPLIALDYPDIGMGDGGTVIKFGDFGPARKEIVEATGTMDFSQLQMGCQRKHRVVQKHPIWS